MNKQIEEMAEDIEKIEKEQGHKLLNETLSYVNKNHRYNLKEDYSLAHKKTIYELTAEELINLGYQKVDKNSVVLTKEEYMELYNEARASYYRAESLEIENRSLFLQLKDKGNEMAREIFNNLLKEFYKRKSCGNADVVVYEIAKQYGVDLGEEQ